MMTLPTLTLADFLLARIAEDEVAARQATPGPWVNWGSIRTAEGDAAVAVSSDGRPPMQPEDSAHVARWDPARVLAECEAKRRIVDNARLARRAMGEAPLEQLLSAQDGPAAAYWRGLDCALRLLALPYADYPDYRQEWRP